MSKYQCKVCNQPIKDEEYTNVLAVIARHKHNLQYAGGFVVHKKQCDSVLLTVIEEKGFSANSSFELSFLGTEENIDYYLETGENPLNR